MSEPIWSQRFAQDVANVLGCPTTQTLPEGRDEALREEDESLLAEITEHFRYLPLEQVNWVFDLAHFLRAREVDEKVGPPPGWAVSKLREVCEYLRFLRQRHGSEQPADEKDYWTDEDRQDLQVATWQRLSEDDPWPEDDYPQEEQGNAHPG
jgi:hypothetical protein